ncbi:unnamed protein product [Lactuca virosa]|uniref:Bicarbonate transporter-like transmembrane domain-containing protein n=1 Tax=Lactuca virosa TaxID=75947 RepID=A0AAU9LTS5_9ASTR|nr:unnamed protein product [Lactuca virosa]
MNLFFALYYSIITGTTTSSSPDFNLSLSERALAAAGAAFLSAVIVNPLDVAKTRLQAQAAGVPYQNLHSKCRFEPNTGSIFEVTVFPNRIQRVCVWTAVMLCVLTILDACTLITRFTRVAGELFGMLISVFFMQEAIKGVISEFHIPKGENERVEEYQFQWLYTNGLLAIILAFGTLMTSMKSRGARAWPYGVGWMRGLIADYGVPLMVLVWTAIYYIKPRDVPPGVPRRLFCPLPWEPGSLSHWTVIRVFFYCCFFSFGVFRSHEKYDCFHLAVGKVLREAAEAKAAAQAEATEWKHKYELEREKNLQLEQK